MVERYRMEFLNARLVLSNDQSVSDMLKSGTFDNTIYYRAVVRAYYLSFFFCFNNKLLTIK